LKGSVPSNALKFPSREPTPAAAPLLEKYSTLNSGINAACSIEAVNTFFRYTKPSLHNGQQKVPRSDATLNFGFQLDILDSIYLLSSNLINSCRLQTPAAQPQKFPVTMTSQMLELESPVEEYTPTFYIGHHESKRPLPVTDFILRQAQDVGV
jgi:hypothetical protein